MVQWYCPSWAHFCNATERICTIDMYLLLCGKHLICYHIHKVHTDALHKSRCNCKKKVHVARGVLQHLSHTTPPRSPNPKGWGYTSKVVSMWKFNRIQGKSMWKVRPSDCKKLCEFLVRRIPTRRMYNNPRYRGTRFKYGMRATKAFSNNVMNVTMPALNTLC